MGSFKEKLQNNFVNFVAYYGKHLIWIINVIFIFLFILTNLSSSIEKYLGPVFRDFLPSFLKENGSNLISLSAIFIGIYFTVFTLIITLNFNSSIAKLSQMNFKTLITFIRNAFIVTFAYVIFLLVIIGNGLDEPEKVTFSIQIINLLNCLFVIYIIMSAFRVALLLYAAYSVDLKNLHKLKTETQQKQNQLDNFISEVQNYMDKH
ncbi:hypothetical protein ABE042_21835 [Viridibacillus arvi]|uniref:hypothetical protein n=1 Tax=Viridibacillus arvi TaxID=263475 RepID=UPI003D2E2255